MIHKLLLATLIAALFSVAFGQAQQELERLRRPRLRVKGDTVSWTQNSGDGGYQLRWRTGRQPWQYKLSIPANQRSYTLDHLPYNRNYRVQVRALSANPHIISVSLWSASKRLRRVKPTATPTDAPDTATPVPTAVPDTATPVPPKPLPAPTLSKNGVLISWTAVVASNSYELRWKTGNGAWSTIILHPSTRSFSFHKYPYDTEYQVEIRALSANPNSNPDSDWSNQITIIRVRPTDPPDTATATATATDTATATATPTSTATATPTSTATATPTSTATATATSTATATPTSTATPRQLPAPQNIRQTSGHGELVEVAWDAVPGASGYHLRWTSELQITLGASTTRHRFTGFAAGDAYKVRVQALGDGISYSHSSWSEHLGVKQFATTTPTFTATHTPTDTLTPTATHTPTVTNTPLPATDTPVPSDTPVPPTKKPGGNRGGDGGGGNRATATRRPGPNPPTQPPKPTDSCGPSDWENFTKETQITSNIPAGANVCICTQQCKRKRCRRSGATFAESCGECSIGSCY